MGLDKPFSIGPETLQPPEVSAVILRHLRDMMARTLNDAHYLLDSAIITMPAYFNHNQIEATRQAGELAGYDVVELLHEPTAAAIYYSWVENHGDATYLVYDLGGGTFDVSIIRKRFDDYEVLSVSGDPFLGGDDFDRVLASYLIESGAVKVEMRHEAGTQPGKGRFQNARPTLRPVAQRRGGELRPAGSHRGGDQDRTDRCRRASSATSRPWSRSATRNTPWKRSSSARCSIA